MTFVRPLLQSLLGGGSRSCEPDIWTWAWLVCLSPSLREESSLGSFEVATLLLEGVPLESPTTVHEVAATVFEGAATILEVVALDCVAV